MMTSLHSLVFEHVLMVGEMIHIASPGAIMPLLGLQLLFFMCVAFLPGGLSISLSGGCIWDLYFH
jgi:hypothetical protein